MSAKAIITSGSSSIKKSQHISSFLNTTVVSSSDFTFNEGSMAFLQGSMTLPQGIINISTKNSADDSFKYINPFVKKTSQTSSARKSISVIPEKKSIFKNLFLDSLEHDFFEFGFSSKTEVLTKSWLEKIPTITKESLNDIYLEHIHDEKVLLSLLKIIAHIDYDKIKPTGPTMAMAAFTHKNIEIRECAIRAFENWGNAESKSILEATEIQPSWLNDYIQDVISDLKEELDVDFDPKNQ